MFVDHVPLQTFGTLEKAEKSAFMRQLVSTLTDDTSYQAVMFAAAMHDAWVFLKAYLKVPKARNSLWEIIDDIQAQAFRSDHLHELSDALPKRMRPDEGLRALIFPVQIKNWEMASEAFDRGAMPGENLFRRVFDDYTREPNEFSKKFILRVAKSHKLPWKRVFSFPDYADGFDLVKRADESDIRGYFVVASGVMTAPQKQRLLKNTSDLHHLLKLQEHMELSKNWRKHLSPEMKVKLFQHELGV